MSLTDRERVRGQNGYVEHARITLPLKLCQAQIIQKAQGITILIKVDMSLTDKEREYSLLHVALSRVTKFTNLGIKDMEGLSKNRICTKIRKYLEEENRLWHLEQITLKYFN